MDFDWLSLIGSLVFRVCSLHVVVVLAVLVVLWAPYVVVPTVLGCIVPLYFGCVVATAAAVNVVGGYCVYH